MTNSSPTYSLIGSCVTRDAGDVGRAPLPAPVHFFSRTRVQSLVSTPTPIDPDEIRLESGFQRRVVAQDHDKTAARVLPTIDHPVVIDLIDERAPLAHTGFGLVTATGYFKKAGFAKRKGLTSVPEDAELADDGPFAEASRRLAALLPQQPVVVHRAYWATHDADGRALEDRARAEATNAWLERAYAVLTASLGERALTVRPNPALTVADPGHRWGVAPFHYVSEYYDELAGQVREHIGSAAPALR
ncbi:DUF6270 domain-containing protein [Glycomyces tenuis]|uniref:DUF6270 domain-containing protein n=1 Tax=Glycomyces tenuis TaxID=58116 RepID=UPI00040A27F1|nr:DUF6270 domain-containing protein [Glycomyces tenuis]